MWFLTLLLGCADHAGDETGRLTDGPTDIFYPGCPDRLEGGGEQETTPYQYVDGMGMNDMPQWWQCYVTEYGELQYCTAREQPLPLVCFEDFLHVEEWQWGVLPADPEPGCYVQNYSCDEDWYFWVLTW